MFTLAPNYISALTELQSRLQQKRNAMFEKLMKLTNPENDFENMIVDLSERKKKELKKIGDARHRLTEQFFKDTHEVKRQIRYFRLSSEMRQSQIIGSTGRLYLGELMNFEQYSSSPANISRLLGKLNEDSKRTVELAVQKFPEEFKGEKGIPGFWLRALENCKSLREYINDFDKEVLRYLIDLRTERMRFGGYKLTFVFEENNYLANTVLQKHIFMAAKKSKTCIRTTQSAIEWKMEDREKKTEKGFFRLFKRSIIPDPREELPPAQTMEPAQTEEQRRAIIQKALDEDAVIAGIIKDQVIPAAIYYYFGLIDIVVKN